MGVSWHVPPCTILYSKGAWMLGITRAGLHSGLWFTERGTKWYRDINIIGWFFFALPPSLWDLSSPTCTLPTPGEFPNINISYQQLLFNEPFLSS